MSAISTICSPEAEPDPLDPDFAPLRLILFDVDGTLLDSIAQIHSAMESAFAAVARPTPPEQAVRGVVGLCLDHAMLRLDPTLTADMVAAATKSYREAFVSARARGAGEAAARLYPGARAALERLSRTETLLGVATGKGREGLECALDAHDLRRFFITTQTGSEAPGKPHPGMVERALSETGAEARNTLVIGDSPYDMAMARNAGARALGVAWGYGAPEALVEAGAEAVLTDFAALAPALEALWGADALREV